MKPSSLRYFMPDATPLAMPSNCKLVNCMSCFCFKKKNNLYFMEKSGQSIFIKDKIKYSTFSVVLNYLLYYSRKLLSQT